MKTENKESLNPAELGNKFKTDVIVRFFKPKYRIKQHYEFRNTSYEVQKKVWFIPFWYNFSNIDGYITGFHDTYDCAIEAIENDKFKSKYSYVNVR